MTTIKTKRLILRPIEKKDKKALIENINNLEITKWLSVVPYPYTEKDADWWINHCREQLKKKDRDSFNFAIELKSEKKQIGQIDLINYDKFQGMAEIGYWLGKNYWRNGYISEALKEVIDFAFNKLKLRRINIRAFSGNEASNGVIKKFGFTHEGISRNGSKCKADNKVHNLELYGMLREEWPKIRSTLK